VTNNDHAPTLLQRAAPPAATEKAISRLAAPGPRRPPLRPPASTQQATIDHLGETYLYEQLAAILRDQIRSGELPPGATMPPMPQLAQQYKIARHTVRQALAVLENEQSDHLEGAGYHTRWARPGALPDDAERIAIREALAFGKAVYDRRVALGLSVADLAGRAGMTADEIECIEEGGTEPTVALLRHLAAVLDADVRLTASHDLGSVEFETHAA
jgi:ribosome-binding protein aMBF1 (putative translation factor)